MNRRALHVLAALAVTATPFVALQAPATAQQTQCANPAGKYPPPEQSCRGLSDTSPAPGQRMSASTGAGSFDRGSRGEAGVQSTYIKVGDFVADDEGRATVTFTVPLSLDAGQHNVVFRGTKDGAPATVRLPFTLVAASTGAPGTDAPGTDAPGTDAPGTDAPGTDVGAGTVNNPRSGVLGALPRTGSNEVVPMAATGIALVVAGAGIVLIARRRREELESSPLA